MNPEECNERIRLTDVDGIRVSETSRIRSVEAAEARYGRAEAARMECEMAWEALERHITEHGCLTSTANANDRVLEAAADAALDVILVADHARHFVDVNRAAVDVLGRPRQKILGRRIDEFFVEAQGQPVPAAWESILRELV